MRARIGISASALSAGFFRFFRGALLGGVVDFLQEFRRLLLEVVDAALAAHEDNAVGLAGFAVNVGDGIAHAAEVLVGNEALLQGIIGARLGDDFGFGF